jgi:fumarate hydratase, class II
MRANEEGCKRSSESTLAAATARNPHIGYDKGAEIVSEAANSGRMLREVAAEMGVDEETYNKAMDLRKMAQGNL